MIEPIDNMDFILDTFKDIIIKYKMSSDVSKQELVLRNKYCKLKFYLEWGTLECDVFKINSYKDYPLKTIPYYGFNDIFVIDYSRADINKLLAIDYKKIVVDYLKDTIESGKFTWIKEYNKNMKFQRDLREKADHLPMNNPIRKKYVEDDPSWEQDLISELKLK